MNDSILISIKKLLGIGEEYTAFDPDIIIHINSVLPSLTQLGLGPSDGFMIHSEKENWNDFIGESKIHQMVISYIYLKVRLIFDPPLSSVLVQAMNEQIRELEWRLSISVEK